MSRIEQYALPLDDDTPRVTVIDGKTGKPYDKDGNPPASKARPTPRAKAATTARDSAIAMVLDNEKKAWHELHDQELTAFLIEKGSDTFIAEDFRRWFMARGHEAPHHPNVWGACWMAAAKRGALAKTGHYMPPQDMRSHARLTTQWAKPWAIA